LPRSVVINLFMAETPINSEFLVAKHIKFKHKKYILKTLN
jgi:hypothetical protein